jgi:flagellar biosynthesis anti-sigma factor FlgM
MKITGQDPAKTAELTLAKPKGKEATPAPAAKKEAARKPAAPLLPSATSLTTARAREAVRSEPDVRADKVAEAKERLRSGKYEVDADRLAGKMIVQSLREDIEKP